MVCIPLEQHLATIEEQAALGGDGDGANAKLRAGFVSHAAVFAIQRQPNGIEIRMLSVPQLRTGNLNLRQTHLADTRGRAAAHLGFPLVDDLAGGICHGDSRRSFLLTPTESHLGCDVHIAIVARSDIERMALEIEFTVGGYQAYTPEQSAPGIPAGISRLTRISHHGDDILLAGLQPVSDVDLEPDIAIVGTANTFTVEVDVGRIDNTIELQEQTAALQGIGRRQMEPVPPLPHLLEPTARQTALDVGRRIVIVGLLVGGRCHPRLLNLEIMRHIDRSPAAVVERFLVGTCHRAGMETPTEIQVLHDAPLGISPQNRH